MPDAQKDFEESFRLAPGAAAAERLGELAELRKDLNGAVHQYALAFALAEGSTGGVTRANCERNWAMCGGWRTGRKADWESICYARMTRMRPRRLVRSRHAIWD